MTPAANTPLVSIVIPVRNCARYVADALESVLSQSHPRKELIVVDGASDDGTQAVIRRYEKSITWWASEPDSGQTEAINKGVARATGDIINWLNGDDRLEPGALAAVAAAWKPGVTAIAGRVRFFDEADPSRGWLERTAWDDDRARSAANEAMRQPATFLARDAARCAFPLEPALRFVMDQELWTKLLLARGVEGLVRIDATLCAFRLHAESKSVSGGADFRMKLSRPFFAEYNALFAGMARASGREAVADCLVQRLDANGDLAEKLAHRWRRSGIDPATMRRCVDWYVLRLLRELDQQGRFDLARELASHAGGLWRTVGVAAYARARLRHAAAAAILHRRRQHAATRT